MPGIGTPQINPNIETHTQSNTHSPTGRSRRNPHSHAPYFLSKVDPKRFHSQLPTPNPTALPEPVNLTQGPILLQQRTQMCDLLESSTTVTHQARPDGDGDLASTKEKRGHRSWFQHQTRERPRLTHA